MPLSSSFNGDDLFGSGPHRFHLGPVGRQVVQRTTIDPTYSGTQDIGPLDGDILIRGRLIAADEAELWTLIDTITGKLTDPPTIADLLDHRARLFKNFAFVSFTPMGRTDRAGKTTLAYKARFTKSGGW